MVSLSLFITSSLFLSFSFPFSCFFRNIMSCWSCLYSNWLGDLKLIKCFKFDKTPTAVAKGVLLNKSPFWTWTWTLNRTRHPCSFFSTECFDANTDSFNTVSDTFTLEVSPFTKTTKQKYICYLQYSGGEKTAAPALHQSTHYCGHVIIHVQPYTQSPIGHFKSALWAPNMGSIKLRGNYENLLGIH